MNTTRMKWANPGYTRLLGVMGRGCIAYQQLDCGVTGCETDCAMVGWTFGNLDFESATENFRHYVTHGEIVFSKPGLQNLTRFS